MKKYEILAVEHANKAFPRKDQWEYNIIAKEGYMNGMRDAIEMIEEEYFDLRDVCNTYPTTGDSIIPWFYAPGSRLNEEFE